MALSLIFIKNYFFSVRPNNKYSLNYSKFMGVNILFISLFENMNTELFEGNFKYKENNFHKSTMHLFQYIDKEKQPEKKNNNFNFRS